ncbi:MAG: Smr/MutS family protein [Spirochaetaceae bacterium]|nr:Smr/MutS family protein [Spirochaetaceae bacterium]
MNFADILDKWDDMEKAEAEKGRAKKGAPQVSHKKANAPTKEEKELLRQGYSLEAQMKKDAQKTINPMEAWLRQHDTIDKDALADEYAESRKMKSRTYIREMAVEARIDLHGLSRDEAWARLNSFVGDCQARGLKKILIIHGKGVHSHGSDPVLGPMVKSFIEQDKRLGSSGHPDKFMGGSGATWVMIREK